jgi:hypothetical protein
MAMMMLGAALCVPSLVSAQSAPMVTDKDLQVAVRAFSFVYGMPKGDIAIEVVYDPDNASSQSEAQQLGKLIGSSGTFANRQVTAKIVPVAQMGAAGDKIAYITHGMQSKYDVMVQRASADKMLTFSTDFLCVDSQKCVMGVEADPAIKMEISRAATSASGLEFSQALKLMIKEVE